MPRDVNERDASHEQHRRKIEGLADEAAGHVKQGLGKATGNGKPQADGKAQRLEGDAQKAVGKAKAKDGVEDAADTVTSKP